MHILRCCCCFVLTHIGQTRKRNQVAKLTGTKTVSTSLEGTPARYYHLSAALCKQLISNGLYCCNNREVRVKFNVVFGIENSAKVKDTIIVTPTLRAGIPSIVLQNDLHVLYINNAQKETTPL